MKTGSLFRSNWSYLIWFLFNYTITFLIVYLISQSILATVLITIAMYAVSLAVAFSPFGEQITRNKLHLQEMEEDEKTYLLPLFQEVYDKAIKANNSISRNIELFVLDNDEINAFALGNNTIVLTKGAIASFSKTEIKGALAHEFGHIINGDTKALLLTNVGNGFFSFFLWIANKIIYAFSYLISAHDGGQFVVIIVKVLVYIVNLAFFIIDWLGKIIISFNSRQIEFLADSYAKGIGYKTELLHTLYFLFRNFENGRQGLLERLQATHPHTYDRITMLKWGQLYYRP